MIKCVQTASVQYSPTTNTHSVSTQRLPADRFITCEHTTSSLQQHRGPGNHTVHDVNTNTNTNTKTSHCNDTFLNFSITSSTPASLKLSSKTTTAVITILILLLLLLYSWAITTTVLD